MTAESLRIFDPSRDAVQRQALHDEVHARPPEGIQLPAQILYVAMLNHGISREQEHQHLALLPGWSDFGACQRAEGQDDWLQGNFLSLALPACRLIWERHTEFTRYTLIKPLAANPDLEAGTKASLAHFGLPGDWMEKLPGAVIAAIELFLCDEDPHQGESALQGAQPAFGQRPFVASLLGVKSDSMVSTDFRIQPSGFERFLVFASSSISEGRAGRISQRLLELETYRLMALRGFPVARELGGVLNDIEKRLAGTTQQMTGQTRSDQALLDDLTGLAARIEQLNAEHGYRFSATRAYHAIVQQRIAELNEAAVPATQTIGEFLGRRLSPAMNTVEATVQRLSTLSERIARTSSLLRTRVDIATEEQNRQLLERLNQGQHLQLRLQSTVEGLSIAAISYYMVSLIVYGAKALKLAGLPVNPEMVAGFSIPLVMWVVWRITRRIHEKILSTH